MSSIFSRTAWLSLVSACVVSMLSVSIQAQENVMNTEKATRSGVEAYIFGYPLVTMEMTRRVMTNAARPNGMRGPMGQFIHAREYPNASFRDVTAPNADTLYSAAWLDLRKLCVVGWLYC